jgi:hypothetical protein
VAGFELSEGRAEADDHGITDELADLPDLTTQVLGLDPIVEPDSVMERELVTRCVKALLSGHRHSVVDGRDDLFERIVELSASERADQCVDVAQRPAGSLVR